MAIDLSQPLPATQPPAPLAELPAQPAPPSVAPVIKEERLVAVDTLRGVAVLGILLMNILFFGLPKMAGGNPNLFGEGSFLDLTFWFVSQVLFEGKMRTIFSMLFGAGVILLTSRAEKRGGQAEIADIYYRRNLWLIAFGMLHAYFLWGGDILYFYGVVGLFLYPLRKAPATALIVAGVVLLALSLPGPFLKFGQIAAVREKAAEADAAVAAQQTPSDEQKKAQETWKAVEAKLKPTKEAVQKEIEIHHGDYWTIFFHRAGFVSMFESLYFYRVIFFDVAGMMLIGMGLMKFGVFSGEKSNRFYTIMAIVGYGFGATLNAYVGLKMIEADFYLPDVGLLYGGTYQIGRLSVALGHVAVVMLLYRKGMWLWLTRRLAAVGQMALSNYLLESVVCVFVFEGFGFGLFGELGRFQLLYVVIPLWTFQLLVSPIWLKFFRFGPMEWIWRALTYWKLPPMLVRRTDTAPALGTA